MQNEFDPAKASTEELETYIGRLISENSIGMKPTTGIGFQEVAKTWFGSFMTRHQKIICGSQVLRTLCTSSNELDRIELISQLLDLFGTLRVPHYVPCVALAHLAVRHGLTSLCQKHWNSPAQT